MKVSWKHEDLLGQDFYKEVTQEECYMGKLKHSTQLQLLKTESNWLKIVPEGPDTLVSSVPSEK